MDRRNFIKAGSLAALASQVNLNSYSAPTPQNVSDEVKSDIWQKDFMDLKFGMFIHFGINTYYDREWSEGDLDPVLYNPTELDTDQWCKVASKAGMKYVVFGTKHHDGFCNFITQHTDYSVLATPFRKDVLAMLADSARKYGLKLGLYYSLWDSNNILHDTNEHAYVDFMKAQMDELLNNYGDILLIWFDGFWKKQQTGWKSEDGSDPAPDQFIQSWRNEGAFRWEMDHLYRYIKSIQPECLIMNNATSKFKAVPLHPVDALCGERALTFKDYRREWEFLGKKRYYPFQIETTMSAKGNERFPNGNWFWHEWDHSVISVETVQSYLDLADRMNANLLLNVGPMANGKLRPEDVEVLSSL
jgi:alpha-L-fucosidase